MYEANFRHCVWVATYMWVAMESMQQKAEQCTAELRRREDTQINMVDVNPEKPDET